MKKRVSVLHHPPYSPDLASVYYFLFSKVKSSMKGQDRDRIEAIEAAVTQEVHAVLQETFERVFDDLYNRHNRSVELNRDNIEA